MSLPKFASMVVSNRQPHKLAIITLVRSSDPGDVITDAQINSATSSKINIWNSAMQAARRVLAAEQPPIALKREKGVGYRHLRDEETAGAADRETDRARRRLKSAATIITCVKAFDLMVPADQVVHMQTKARVMIGLETLSPRRKREIAAVVTSSNVLAGDVAAIGTLGTRRKKKV